MFLISLRVCIYSIADEAPINPILRRLVIPTDLRRSMNIGKGTPLEMLVDGESLILKKYEPGCVFLRQPGKCSGVSRQKGLC